MAEGQYLLFSILAGEGWKAGPMEDFPVSDRGRSGLDGPPRGRNVQDSPDKRDVSRLYACDLSGCQNSGANT
eukprot:1923211-Alexandrium_andersonii.AAC.1